MKDNMCGCFVLNTVYIEWHKSL